MKILTIFTAFLYFISPAYSEEKIAFTELKGQRNAVDVYIDKLIKDIDKELTLRIKDLKKQIRDGEQLIYKNRLSGRSSRPSYQQQLDRSKNYLEKLTKEKEESHTKIVSLRSELYNFKAIHSLKFRYHLILPDGGEHFLFDLNEAYALLEDKTISMPIRHQISGYSRLTFKKYLEEEIYKTSDLLHKTFIPGFKIDFAGGSILDFKQTVNKQWLTYLEKFPPEFVDYAFPADEPVEKKHINNDYDYFVPTIKGPLSSIPSLPKAVFYKPTPITGYNKTRRTSSFLIVKPKPGEMVISMYYLKDVKLTSEKLLSMFETVWNLQELSTRIKVSYHEESDSLILLSSPEAKKSADVVYQTMLQRIKK